MNKLKDAISIALSYKLDDIKTKKAIDIVLYTHAPFLFDTKHKNIYMGLKQTDFVCLQSPFATLGCDYVGYQNMTNILEKVEENNIIFDYLNIPPIEQHHSTQTKQYDNNISHSDVNVVLYLYK